MALKTTKSGTFDKRQKAMKTLSKDIETATANIEAGTQSISDALKTIPKEYQGIVSEQMKLNKMIEEQGEKYDGVYGSFLEGVGLVRDKSKELGEALEEAIASADPKKIDAAQEAMKKFKEEAKLSEEVIGDFEDIFPGIANGLKGIGKLQAFFNKLTKLNPYMLIIAAVLAVGAALVGLVKQANSLSQEFGGGVKANIAIAKQLKLSTIRAKFFGLSAEQVRSSFDAIANTFGDVSVASARFAVDMARVSRNTGVSAENVANLVSLFNPLTNNSRELSLSLVESVSSLAQAQGVASGVLIDELASNADLFASFIGKGEKNLIKAAAAAKKVGVEFNGIVDLGDSLLSITERINKEQVASTIAQKQINLERFTALMAADKQVEAQEELARILKDVNLTEMRSQQRRLFAQALGVPLADLMRISGLRSGGMPMAGGAGASGMSAYEKQTLESEKNQEKYLKEIRNDLR